LGGVSIKDATNIVANGTETGKEFALGAGNLARVKKRPMMPTDLTGKHRANLISMTAKSDDGGHRFIEKFVKVLRAMAQNINAHFGHHLDGERIDFAGRIGTGTVNIRQVTERRAQKSFGHLAAAGVAGTEKENYGLGLAFTVQRHVEGLASVINAI
jgi:hypothetical protein